MNKMRVMVAGANGYVGRHLIPVLLDNFLVSALVRKKDPKTELLGADYFIGDCEKAVGLEEAFNEAEIAYYLIHSLDTKNNFQAIEARCAKNFATAARKAGIKRIIYLSGLGHSQDKLSEHLASRHAVGEILRDAIADVVEFRASAVFGAGSTSYEMISFLVERLPLMILPKWVYKRTQPVSIIDAIYYLNQAADISKKLPTIIEIGGLDAVSYKEVMTAYAKKRGLKRIMIPVPFLSLNLSSLWLFLFTPLQARVGKNIILSLKNDTVVRSQEYRILFDHRPLNLSEMITQTLEDETREILSPQTEHLSRFNKAERFFGFRFGRYIIKRDFIEIEASPDAVFNILSAIGGENGWYYLNFLWRFRALLDRALGGPGFSHGKSIEPLAVGHFIDCWRIEEIKRPKRLLLASLMKMPGDAHLEFEIIPKNKGSLLYQTALFRPKGLIGSIYWKLLYPAHFLLFEGLLRAIKTRSEKKHNE